MIDDFPELRAAELIKNHPEFKTAGPLAVSAIRFALPQVDETVFGDKTDLAIELIACDWLAKSPYGTSLRGADDGKPTGYQIMLDSIKEQVSIRMFVI